MVLYKVSKYIAFVRLLNLLSLIDLLLACQKGVKPLQIQRKYAAVFRPTTRLNIAWLGIVKQ